MGPRRWKPGGIALYIALFVVLGVVAAISFRVVGNGRRDRALVVAVRDNATVTAMSLLQSGADPNARVNLRDPDSAWTYLGNWFQSLTGSRAASNDVSEPLLIVAAESQNRTVFETLVSHGADVNVKDSSGMSPLLYETMLNDIPGVTLLLDRHANVDVRGADGTTPLWTAVFAGHDGMVELLLKRGADANAKGLDGSTPLMAAAISGNVPLVRSLIRSHADVNAKDKSGNSPLKFARHENHAEVVRMLRAAGAKR
jgi:ankyrin repeat protein